MEWLVWFAMLLVLLAFTALIREGGLPLRRGAAGAESACPPAWPPVALIVPVTGVSPGLRERLESLLAQDYPRYGVVFVTRDADDPAISVIRPVIWGRPHARHVVGGPARGCGQKNHNLLAGVRCLGPEPEILTFCDSNQMAPPSFLRNLVQPIACSTAAITTGYHHIIPRQPGLAPLVRAVVVLTLYCTKGLRWFNQPWGGATAMSRQLFEDLTVERLWGRTVVDDVSLAARLKKAGIRVCLAPRAILTTAVDADSLAGWSHWLFRQCIYLKFYFPGSWLAAGIFQGVVLGLVLLSLGVCLLAPWGYVSFPLTLAALLFLAIFTLQGLWLRRHHPSPGSRLSWLGAFYAAMFLGFYVHARTGLTSTLTWRGISYRVNWRGEVVDIRES